MNSVLSEFRDSYRKLEKRFINLKDYGNLNIKVDNTVKEISAESTSDSKEFAEYLSVLYSFVNHSSRINHFKILEIIQQLYSDKLDKKELEKISDEIEANNKFKILKINDGYPPNKLFDEIFKSYNFDSITNLSENIISLIKKPVVSQVIWYEFYTYAITLFTILSRIFDLIQKLEKEFSEKIPVSPCIICKSVENTFKAVEHIFPDSLGNSELILEKGFVCDNCNSEILSKIDEDLQKFSPIAFLRVYFTPYTKSGKLPSANFQNMSIIKSRANKIDIKFKDKSTKIKKEKLSGDLYKFNTTFRSGPLNIIKVMRSLYKIAYETLALKNGKDFVLSEKYKDARSFIKNEIEPYNNLLILNNISPQNILQCTYNINDNAAVFIINIFGILFMLNLEREPLLFLNEELKKFGFSYLYNKK